MKKYPIILTCLITACGSLKNPGQVTSVQQTDRFMPLEKFKGDTLNYVQKNFSGSSSKTISLKQFKGDTLLYVQTKFINNKQKYIGKELNELLKDLEIPVKSYVYGTSFIDSKIIPDITLDFYDRDLVIKKIDRIDKPINIIIKWAPPLSKDVVYDLVKKSKGQWLEADREYYGKQIVGDIFTTKWDH